MDIGYHIRLNSSVEGLNKTYEAWEVKPSRLIIIPETDLVCLACCVFLPMRYKPVYIGYHKTILEFMKVDLGERIIYSFFFIPAGNQRNAEKIIEDIRGNYRNLQF